MFFDLAAQFRAQLTVNIIGERAKQTFTGVMG
jgi:hypothetical protein